jgi:hypothetical protein
LAACSAAKLFTFGLGDGNRSSGAIMGMEYAGDCLGKKKGVDVTFSASVSKSYVLGISCKLTAS